MTRVQKAAVATHRCPRCRGKLALDRDRYGVYESCFMCGFTRDRHAGPLLLNPFEEAELKAS